MFLIYTIRGGIILEEEADSSCVAEASHSGACFHDRDKGFNLNRELRQVKTIL